ncbi:MAG TPA: hypothetical protein VEU76_01505 [Candidatus Udaeobacter sp.]|nr:hypothetical protein [Candidatus Udaeobacter sp.]
MRERDHIGGGSCDLGRHLDRPVARLFEVFAGAHRLDKRQVSERVELHELLRAQAQSLGTLMRGRGAGPRPGAQRDLLQQRRRGGHHRGRGRTAGGCGSRGRDLAQKMVEPAASPFLRIRQSPPFAWS